MKDVKYNLQQATRLLFQIIVDKRIFNLPPLYTLRIIVYKLLFNIGKGCFIGEHVFFDREHKKMDGSIKIGNKVQFARNIHIDYTGFVEIKDNVAFGNGVEIISHHYDLEERLKGNEINIQTKIVIEDGAFIGTKAVILDTCNRIGKNARIGAGSVVTTDVPDNVMVAGVPAKIIKQIGN